MSNSSVPVLLIVLLSLLFVNLTVAFKMVKSPVGKRQSPNSNNQQSLKHKLGSQQQSQSPPEEENLRDFCTLTNFQNCISELWPGSSSGSSSPPVSTSEKRKTANGHESSLEATTVNGPITSNDLAFPTTFRQLQATCSDLKERVRCLDRHSERCFTPEMLQVFGHIVTNAKQFVHDLCDNKRVQSEFLIHAKCFRNISLDEQKCGQEYRDAINIPGSESGAQNKAHSLELEQYELLPIAAKLVSAGQQAQEFQIKELIMRRSCCALQELVLCKRRHVREQCGESAAIFMRDHLPRITNPVLEQHCSAYTYGPGTCDEALYRRRVNADGQLVATNPYHRNPFGSNPAAPSSQQLGGDSDQMTHNQMSHGESNHSKGVQMTVAMQIYLLLYSTLTALLITSILTKF